jgi:hypothetical protein
MPRRVAADHTGSHDGWPGDPPPDGRPSSVVRKNARAPRAGRFELLHRDVEVGVVDDGDRVEPVGLGRQLLTEEVVAAADPGGTVGAEELQLLPVATRVHQAVVDADAVHPADALRRRRVVQRVQDDRTYAPRPCAPGWGSSSIAVGRWSAGKRGEEVTGDPERQHVEAARQLVASRRERELVAREARRLPMGVDVDDHGAPQSRSAGQELLHLPDHELERIVVDGVTERRARHAP